MARRKVPAYCRHKGSNQAYVKIDGNRVYLGVYGTPDSHKRYTVEIAKWQARQDEPAQNLTVSHLAVTYIEHCRTYYRKGGAETTEVKCIRLALKLLLRQYRNCPVNEFDALKLERVRDAMIAAGWVRISINRHMGRIRRMFRWGVKRKLVSRGTFIDVCALESLAQDRSDARESEPVEAVSDAAVDAALKHVSRPVRGLIEFMRHTGARPGEALIVRACDINMSGKVWEYRPVRHKTQHHKKQRVVMIGPSAQKLLRPFLKTDTQAFLFDPRDAIEDNVRRYREGAKRRQDIGTHYTLHSLAAAIRRGCEKAEVEVWSANQLRHSFGTKARRAAGIEASRVVLGHSSAVTSEIYAERDFDAARAVVAQIG